MNDSPDRPVSIELGQAEWATLVSWMEDSGRLAAQTLAAKISRQLPIPVPTGIGAVIRAKSGGHRRVDWAGVLVRAEARDGDPEVWRDPLGAQWFMSDEIVVTEVLSYGVEDLEVPF